MTEHGTENKMIFSHLKEEVPLQKKSTFVNLCAMLCRFSAVHWVIKKQVLYFYVLMHLSLLRTVLLLDLWNSAVNLKKKHFFGLGEVLEICIT